MTQGSYNTAQPEPAQPSNQRYDRKKPYQWNYDNAPPQNIEPEIPLDPVSGGPWKYCGLNVESPLAVAAGPLLNGRWILYYAHLGFDVLTYKTVRSEQRDSYGLPNLQPVNCPPMTGHEDSLPATQSQTGSWAISYGMPSAHPDSWRTDIQWTRNALPRKKLLSVSVVASPKPGWTLEQIASDFAKCAQWAVQSGADCIELNFSCPNVSTCDGQLYQQSVQAGLISQQVKQQIGPIPLLIKIGHVTDQQAATELSQHLAPHADALVMTNGISTRIIGIDGQPLFEGKQRGIGGDVVRNASLNQVAMFKKIISQQNLDLQIVAVGGISTAEHVKQYLENGACAVQLATAPMLEPTIGSKIRSGLI
jgi:dihydroorotate dehydrogenase (NAD+) catalytic subunit